jgi:hypothetical protein
MGITVTKGSHERAYPTLTSWRASLPGLSAARAEPPGNLFNFSQPRIFIDPFILMQGPEQRKAKKQPLVLEGDGN